MQNTIINKSAGWRALLGPLYTLLLLWLIGAGLRITVLAIPPLIPLLHESMPLSQTNIGMLAGLPPLLFACAAIPGSLLIARFGVMRMLICGLLLTAVTAALRSLSPNVMVLFATTFAMGASIAIMQPAVPPIVRQWQPHRMGFATAIYANGMQFGETLSASLTLPLIVPLTGGSWRLSLAFWSLPVLVAAVLVLLRARNTQATPAPAAATTAVATGKRRWWPDWHDPLTWQLGLLVGAASCIFFATQAFLPDYLTGSGRADLVAAALAALTLSQVATTVLLLFLAQRLALKRYPFLIAGSCAVIGFIGLLLTPGAWVVLWCSMLGFCCAFTFTLAMAIPPSIAAPEDVPRLSAAVFTISYLAAFVVPMVGGASWDLTGIPATAFIPAGLCGLLIIGLALTLRFDAVHQESVA